MEEERYIEIVTTYSPMVYRVALHDCRNHADAEDIMQNDSCGFTGSGHGLTAKNTCGDG